MFGYIAVYKEQISEKDYDTFRSYYCGLCKAMGKKCSQISRLGLSYDITFLAMVLSSLEDNQKQCRCERCIAHPFTENNCIYGDRAVEYAASAGVILDYLKLLDDWHDEKSIKALLAMTALKGGMKKAVSGQKKLYDGIKYQLGRLSILESKNSPSIDETADCFAKILEMLFTPDFIEDTSQKRILQWFGYNIGRWIYVIDAVNDMEKDYKNKSYNPFNAAFDGETEYSDYAERIREEKEITLTLTLDNAASAFELMDIKYNETLLRNIIYDCLKTKQKQILVGDKYESV